MGTPDPQPTQGERSRRRNERRPVSMRGNLVLEDGVRHIIELIDLNYGGCGVRTPVELRPGESVKLTVLGRGSIPAEVRWCSDGRAGLDFNPAIEPTEKVIERLTDRTPISAEVNLRTLGRNSYLVQVFDLSTDGCRVEFVERPRVDDQLSVKFDGLDTLEADVRWVEGQMAGLVFRNRLHPAVFDLLLRRLKAT